MSAGSRRTRRRRWRWRRERQRQRRERGEERASGSPVVVLPDNGAPGRPAHTIVQPPYFRAVCQTSTAPPSRGTTPTDAASVGRNTKYITAPAAIAAPPTPQPIFANSSARSPLA